MFSLLALAALFALTSTAEPARKATNAPTEASVQFSEVNQAKIAAIHRAGEPITLAELDQWYPTPPSDQNAATIYTNAFAALSAAEPKTPTFLSSNQKALALLHQAATRPQCRYPIDLNQGSFTPLPHLQKIKVSAELLQNEAVVAALQGKTEEATKSVIAGLAVARSLEQEPGILSQLVRARVIEYPVIALESTLNRIALSDEQLVRIATTMQAAEAKNTTTVVRSLIGERCMALTFFRSPDQAAEIFRENEQPADPQIVAMLRGHLKSPAAQTELTFYLDHVESLIVAMKTPGTNSLKFAEKWDQELSQVKKTNLFAFPVSEAVLPALATLPKKSQTALAYLRVAQTALAVELFRVAHDNQTPHSLNELAPQYLSAIPEDPFSGAPLRYRQNTPKGYTVYSVGPDQQDDGGTHKPLKVLKNSSYDLAFTVLR